MFAIALWDRLERRLVLARDRFGIKPLYYRMTGGELSFASELKALLRQPGFSHEVDLDAARGIPGLQLDPGPADDLRARPASCRRGTCCCGREASRRCAAMRARGPWSPAASAREDERALAEELRERLRDSVRAHLVSDVPVGVLLSGGIDSSALAALAARESSYRVSTFSIGFEERAFNELDQARLVAQQYGTDHHELIVRPDADRAAPAPRGGVRRAVRRLVGPAHLPRLAARRRHREGGAVRRGRRRAVRRLLHLCGGHAGAAHRPRRLGSAAARGGACRAPPARSASTTRRSASFAPRTSRRSSATTAGRRSSPPTRARSCSTAAVARSTRSTSTAPATPRRRERTSSRGCRTSTSGSTWPTTCS